MGSCCEKVFSHISNKIERNKTGMQEFFSVQSQNIMSKHPILIELKCL